MPTVTPRTDVPHWKSLLWPTLTAVRDLGGSASIQEIEHRVAETIGATELQQAVPHGDGRYTEINYRLAWARTYLKGAGYLETTGRGVWSITEGGRSANQAEMATVEARYRALRRRAVPREQPVKEGPEALDRDAQDDDGALLQSWRDELLRQLLALSPDGFEHLAKRLLREAGFVQVEVTGRSGDGGIDGTGIYRPSLVSFPVFFQCKRYKGGVGASQVRDFRGAMAGRGAQGILITTGTFTADAKAEASRPGAPLIDLIDGDALCTLMKEYRLGVSATSRVVEDVVVVPQFFDQI